MDLGNILNAVGISGAGAAPVLQQQNVNQLRMQAMQRLAQAAQQNQAPGFSPYPSANTGTPLPNGAPITPGTPGGAPNMGAPPAIAGPPPMPSMPAGINPGVTPYGGPAITPPSDPFSYPNVANAFFGPGSNAQPDSVLAYDATEKALRPYGQIQGRSQLESQKDSAAMSRTEAQIGSREWIAQTQEQGRNSRFYVTASQRVQQMSNVNLRAIATTTSQQLANRVPDPDGKIAAAYAASADELQKRASAAGYKSEFSAPGGGGSNATAPAAGGVPLPKEMQDKPDGTTVPDETGKLWKKQGNQLIPQG